MTGVRRREDAGNYVVLLQRTISKGGPRAAAEGWRALRSGAARLVVALALVPAGCARDGPPEEGVRPIPGAGRPFPDLSTVPERPRTGDAERGRMMEKLRSDREEAERIRERNERSSASGPATAPGRKKDDGP